jgi:hypothetical protein
MRRFWVAAAAVAAVSAVSLPLAASASGAAGGGNGQGPQWTMAVYGDSPYGNDNVTPRDTWQLDHTPQFVDQINADPDVSLVTHVGDIHSGQGHCSLEFDQAVAADWTAFADPLVYTPGDNEWADCHKTGEGKQDPMTNLGYVRDTFFPVAGATLGSGHLDVTSQANAFDPAHPDDAQFVENVMFEKKGVMFVTLNIPGGSNNDADPWFGAAETPTQTAARNLERQQRTDADLRWLDQAFSVATQAGDKSVVIIEQADMWDTADTAAHETNYNPFIQSIADHTVAFAKPVLMLMGDSHLYRSDNPLRNDSSCVVESGPATTVPCAPTADAWDRHPSTASFTAPNVSDDLFHRVVVHGSTTPLQWLKLTINANVTNPTTDHSFGPFTWQRINTGLQP